jgi:hypothetical protein
MPKGTSFFSSNRSLSLILLSLLGIAGACQILHIARLMGMRGDTTYPESAVVQTALWAKDSGRIYPALNEPPYTPAPYGPAFYEYLVLLARFIHAGFDRLLVSGRGVSAACFFFLLVGVYQWARKQRLDPLIALMAPAFILSQIDFADWNVSVRADLPALLPTFAAFYFLSVSKPTWKRVAAAGLFCAVAGLFKQSFIALPLVAMLWLLLTRCIQHLLIFLAAAAAPVLVVFGWLNGRHEPFLQEMLMARYSPLSPSSAISLIKADLLHFPLQIVLFGLGLLGLMLMPKDNDEARHLRLFCALYFSLCWLMSFYVVMAPGASVNTFLESWMLAASFVPFAVREWVESWNGFSLSVKAIQIILLVTIMGISLEAWRITVSTSPSDDNGLLTQSLQRHRILADVPYLSAHSQQPEMLDPSVNHYLELAGRWSSDRIQNELRAGAFDYVIIGASNGQIHQWRGLTLFSGLILREIEKDYRPYCVGPRMNVYVPHARVVDDPTVRDALKKAGCTSDNVAMLSDAGWQKTIALR